MKVSIVIPTYNHLEDCLKPCLESIIKTTNLNDVEIVLSCNGCRNDTLDYLKSLPIDLKVLWSNEALGFTKAVNDGIETATGDYIVILNNDVVLLDQPKNQWIDMLKAPFETDNSVGITGAAKNYHEGTKHDFLLFFCVMIKREIIEKLGLLDEIFNPGYGEDIDYCYKIRSNGYKVVQVPNDINLNRLRRDDEHVLQFPIWHKSSQTVHGVDKWDEVVKRNEKTLLERVNSGYYKLSESIKNELLKKFKQEVLGLYQEIFEINSYNVNSDEINGKVVIDIGANRGYFSAFASLNGAKKVYAYEPADIYEKLCENVKLFNNIITKKQAIVKPGQKGGYLLYNNNDSLTQFKDTCPRLTADANLGEFTDCVSLNEVIKDIEEEDLVMKIDCEGSEYDILMNTSLDIIQRFKYIYAEFHNGIHSNPNYNYDILEDFMKNNGYSSEKLKKLDFIPGEWLSNDNGDSKFIPSKDKNDKIKLFKFVRMSTNSSISLESQTAKGNENILLEKYESNFEEIHEYLKSNEGWVYYEIFDVNVYCLEEKDVKNKVVVDIGANIGCFAQKCIDMGAKRIYCFEPQKDNFDKLIHLSKTNSKIVPFNLAVLDGSVNEVSISNDRVCSSIYTNSNNKTKCISLKEAFDIAKEREGSGLSGVLLKIDCEGAEYEILFNNSPDVVRFADTICIEMHDNMNPKYINKSAVLKDYIYSLGFNLSATGPISGIWNNDGSFLPSENSNLKYTKRPKYSIIIPTYNHLEDCLKPCIDSIIKHTDLSDVEVIVVANGCTDGTKEYIESLGKPFRLVWMDEAAGFCKPVNTGINASIGEYVIILNNDATFFGNDWLNMLAKPFATDPQCGMSGPMRSWFQFKAGWNFMFLTFGCAMISREVINKVGLLDESLYAFGDDLDYCCRVDLAGYTIKDVSNFPINHWGAKTFATTNREQLINKNLTTLVEKYSNCDLSVVPARQKNDIGVEKWPDYLPTAEIDLEITRILSTLDDDGQISTKIDDRTTCVISKAGSGRGLIISMEDLQKIVLDKTVLTDKSHKSIKEWVLSRGGFFATGGEWHGGYLVQQNPTEFSSFLYDHKDVKVKNYLEIGVSDGGFSRYMCDVLDIENIYHMDLGEYIHINPHYPSYRQNLINCNNSGTINIFRGDSHSKKADNWLMQQNILFDFIFIDGDHSYDGVKQDTELAIKYAKDGCVFAFHDHAIVADVNKFIQEVKAGKYESLSFVKEYVDTISPYGISTFKYTDYHKQKSSIKYSIVIPTYNHLDDCLKPCIESIIHNTNLSNVEVIIVANGCTDGTKKYFNFLPKQIKNIWIDEPVGYIKATNAGIKEAKGEFIVLLNNDTIIKDNSWLSILEKPFNDSSVGISGPMKAWRNDIKSEYILFFCAMIKNDVFKKVGFLDESFGIGYNEDTDFCMRAVESGYRLVEVPEDVTYSESNQGTLNRVKNFPIFHKGGGTFSGLGLTGNERADATFDILYNKHRLNKPIMIYDCFTFFNEFDLLEIRLNELDDIVDRFIISEARFTFQGNPKPLYFEENKQRFAKFLNKIEHIVIDKFPETTSNWDREIFQRNSLFDRLNKCNPNDIIILSDVDEIPFKSAIEKYKNMSGIYNLEYDLYYYYLNCKYNDVKWNMAKIFRYADIKNVSAANIRVATNNCPTMPGAGSHFSYLGGADHIISKIQSYSHSEYNNATFIDKSKIENKIKNCKDIFDRNISISIMDDLSYLPQSVLSDRNKYKSLFLENTPMVYDCFIFFNELDVLEIRLNELNDVVDRFVLVEAKETHQGNPKPLYFEENKQRFSKFLHKIEHIIVDQFPNTNDAHGVREPFQRNAMLGYLKRCNPNDIIILSDVDEIPRASVISSYRIEMGLTCIQTDLFYYRFNLLSSEKWYKLRIFPYSEIGDGDIQQFRGKRDYEYKHTIYNGGWHFSFLGNNKDIRTKIESYSHPEYNKDEIKNDNNISVCVENGKDIFGRNITFTPIPVDNTFPKYLVENIGKFQDAGLIAMAKTSIKDILKEYKVDLTEVYDYNCYCLDEKDLKGKIVVDIGASSGEFSFRCIEMGSSKCYTFEPLSSQYSNQIILINRLNLVDSVIPHNVAILDGSVDEVNLSSEGDSSNIWGKKDVSKVKCISFADILSLITEKDKDMILKMDCEGSEFDIFFNSPKEVFNRFSILHVEIHDQVNPNYIGKTENLIKYIESLGFSFEKAGPQFGWWDNNGNFTPGPVKCLKFRRNNLPEGWFGDDDINFYKKVYTSLPVGGKSVEIGAWQGRSICSVADIIAERKINVVAVDTFTGSPNEDTYNEALKTLDIENVFKNNLNKFGIHNNVQVIKSFSSDAAKLFSESEFDFIFIDGDHTYEAVFDDICSWISKLKENGIIAGHDYAWSPNIRKAVNEIFGNKVKLNYNIWYIDDVKSIRNHWNEIVDKNSKILSNRYKE